MTNNFPSCSPEYFSESNPLRQICAEHYQSTKSGTRNVPKWHFICLFIIVITMRGLCETAYYRTDKQIYTSKITFKVVKGEPGHFAGWRGSGDRSAPLQNIKVRPFSTKVFQTASDAGCRQFVFYQNTFIQAILNSYLTQQKS